MKKPFIVKGSNPAAPFKLVAYRGEGMSLLAMNWKGKPPKDFVGFAIEYKEPKGDKFFALKNRLSFPGVDGEVVPNILSTRLSPIQKFRWVHFPRNPHLTGEFIYRVIPVFMNTGDELSYGESQEAGIELRQETYPDLLNVTFTRGFVSSQAFVDRYGHDDSVKTLLPAKAEEGLTFKPTHPKADEALAWMGFEAREAILKVLDDAIADKKAKVFVVAYDLCERELVNKLKKLGSRLKIIIDNDGAHKKKGSGENQAEEILVASAGRDNVKRHHMGKLQHNKTIVVDGPKIKAAVCGSTNYSWRGFFVQSNNAMILKGKKAIKPFVMAFESYWENDNVAGFGKTASAILTDIGLTGLKAHVGFSPYASKNSLLNKIAKDVSDKTSSSLFFSLAFLYQTPGVIKDAVIKNAKDKDLFVYGISDKKGGGLDFLKPDGSRAVVSPAALSKNIPQPFKSEPKGGGGNRMHHKFIVIDFNKPTARVYLGSYNFSVAADSTNGENLLVIHDQRIAVSYVIEALRIFDHYHFRVVQQEAKKARKKLQLKKPPRNGKEKPWWLEDYTNARKISDRELFA